MKEEDIILYSNQDRLNISAHVIYCDYPIGIIQMVHGMCEYKDRYYNTMREFASKGYICVIHDHRGHGKSIKNEDDLGYFYESKDLGYVEDIKLITDYIKGRFPYLPIFLFGHSMGSLGVRAYIKKYDDYIDGLIVCGSPSYNKLAPLGLLLINLLEKIKGEHYKSPAIHNMIVGSFNKPFKQEKLKNAWICSDHSIVEAYNNDSLCNYIYTLNGCETLLKLMKTVYSKKGWIKEKEDLPIHFISGQDDPCRTNNQSFMSSIDFLKNIGYTRVSYKLYENMRHEILNETNKQEVYDDVITIINQWTKEL